MKKYNYPRHPERNQGSPSDGTNLVHASGKHRVKSWGFFTSLRMTWWFSILFFTSLFSFANPPPTETVFQLTAERVDPNSFLLKWHIKDGFLLYKKSIKLSQESQAHFQLGNIILPAALQKTDGKGHSYDIYRKQILLTVPVLGKESGEASLDVHFQGCSDDGFCYPPQQSKLKLTFDSKLALNQISIDDQQEPISAKTNQVKKSTDLEQLFSGSSWGIIILSFFGFGLLLAFTPCVLPMIPVLSGIIVGHGHHLSTRKAFLLSLSYVLSMSVTYSLIGAVIAFMGNNLQVVMQSPWAISLFSLIFILLALSMFDVYELRLPVSLQSKMANITRSQHGGHYLSAGIMGCLSILILSPCVTAPLIGVLGYIAHEGSIGLGILSLFFLGLGMGTPLLLIGTSAGKFLPKAGQWMNEVKAFFGVMLLAVAIYLLGRLLPNMLTMGLWACLLIFSGIYLGAFSRATSKLDKFNQGAGLILLVYGVLILIGASRGHSNPLEPLKPEYKASYSLNAHQKITAKTVGEAVAVLASAKLEGKPVMVDFYADWCPSCKEMSSTTLRDSRVKNALSEFVILIVDLSANSRDSRDLLTYFNVVAPPTFLFFDADGRELENLRLVGKVSAEALIVTSRDI